MKFLKLSGMLRGQGSGVSDQRFGASVGGGTSGQSHTAEALPPTRGSPSRVSRRIPQMISTCEINFATPRSRFQDERLDHSPASIIAWKHSGVLTRRKPA